MGQRTEVSVRARVIGIVMNFELVPFHCISFQTALMPTSVRPAIPRMIIISISIYLLYHSLYNITHLGAIHWRDHWSLQCVLLDSERNRVAKLALVAEEGVLPVTPIVPFLANAESHPVITLPEDPTCHALEDVFPLAGHDHLLVIVRRVVVSEVIPETFNFIPCSGRHPSCIILTLAFTIGPPPLNSVLDLTGCATDTIVLAYIIRGCSDQSGLDCTLPTGPELCVAPSHAVKRVPDDVLSTTAALLTSPCLLPPIHTEVPVRLGDLLELVSQRTCLAFEGIDVCTQLFFGVDLLGHRWLLCFRGISIIPCLPTVFTGGTQLL